MPAAADWCRRLELELARMRVEAPPGIETAGELRRLELELERLHRLERCQHVDERERR